MSAHDPPEDPSMEEILASIRRIISEDSGVDVPPVRGGEEVPAVGIEMRKPDASAGNVSPADTGDDPFELVQEIQEDGTVVDLKTGKTVHGIAETDEFSKAEPDKEISNKEDKFVEDSILSLETGLESVTSLSALAAAIENPRRGSDPSGDVEAIKDLTRDVMRPMIREWLDENLPSLVERLVGREIERLTREAEENYQG